MIFAYTIKGYGLSSQGHPQNHSSLLTDAQLAARVGTDPDRPRRVPPPPPYSYRSPGALT